MAHVNCMSYQIILAVSRSLSVTFAELCTRMGVREERQEELTDNSIIGEIRMGRTIKAGFAFAALAGVFLVQPTLHAQDRGDPASFN
jgi:hypothetical protein